MIIYGDKGGYKTDTNTETVSSVVFVAGGRYIYQYGSVCKSQFIYLLSS